MTISSHQAVRIAGKRGVANVPDLRGSTADVAVYLAGRPFSGVTPQTGQRHRSSPGF